MVSDWNFLPSFLLLSRRSDSSSGSQQCHSEGTELSLGCSRHWWLDLSASFLFLPLSTKPPWFCSYSDKEIGRTLSLLGECSIWQRRCSHFFLSFCVLTWSARLGWVRSSGCKVPSKQTDNHLGEITVNYGAAWLQGCSWVAAAVVMKDVAWPTELSKGGTRVMVGRGGGHHFGLPKGT